MTDRAPAEKKRAREPEQAIARHRARRTATRAHHHEIGLEPQVVDLLGREASVIVCRQGSAASARNDSNGRASSDDSVCRQVENARARHRAAQGRFRCLARRAGPLSLLAQPVPDGLDLAHRAGQTLEPFLPGERHGQRRIPEEQVRRVARPCALPLHEPQDRHRRRVREPVVFNHVATRPVREGREREPEQRTMRHDRHESARRRQRRPDGPDERVVQRPIRGTRLGPERERIGAARRQCLITRRCVAASTGAGRTSRRAAEGAATVARMARCRARSPIGSRCMRTSPVGGITHASVTSRSTQ